MSAYLIDPILPKREIHLLAGPTGAGKTRWLTQTLLEWQSGLPIFGFRSYPAPWTYASADRTAESAKRTVDSMGINSSHFPFIPAWDLHLTLSQIIDAAQKEGAELLVIESFGSFVEGSPTSAAVKRFMQATSTMLRDTGITIIGVVESPKMKPNERYSNPRQRISGVASWGHFADTIILVEPVPRQESSARRTITICPRNSSQLIVNAEFRSDGHLHYLDPDL